MKVYNTSEIRNVSLAGNAGSGKTTFAEAMVFNGGVISRRGDINSKNTVSDYRPIEHENGSSIFSTVMYAEWKNSKINIIDCPGADDFLGGMYAAVRVTATSMLLVNAQNGVEVGTEIQLRYLRSENQPTMVVINHLDHEKTNWEKTVEDLRSSFGNKAVVMQYPVNPGPEFNCIVDVLHEEMYTYTADGKREAAPIPDSEKERASMRREQLVEAAAESTEELMEKFFDAGELSQEEIIMGVKEGIKSGNLNPIFVSSAKNNIGVQLIMDFVVDAFPSPGDVPSPVDTKGNEIKCDSNGPLSAFVFKTSVEQHLGEVLYMKVESGTINEGDDVINVNKQSKERLSQLAVCAGKNREKVSQVMAGDIISVVKLKETKVNHTLGTKETEESPKLKFPNPKFRTAIKAINESDEEKLNEVLQRMSAEDPTYILEYSRELKQLIIHGQGEHHLNILKWRLDNIFKIETEFITPKIPYRETITKAAQSTYRHKKQSGGAGQFGEVHMIIEPYEEGKPKPKTFKIGGSEYTVNVKDEQTFELEWGGKLVFYTCIVGGVIDTRFMPAILKGIMEKMETGPLTGCYARDIRVAVYDGKMHPVDSNEISFKLAGMNAFKDAFKNAGPKIMEPVYDVEVLVPSDKMGDVMSDLQGRRAIIQGMASEGGYEKLTARVPLAEMNKYSTSLSSLTSGRATYTMQFADYAQVPGEEQSKLLKAYEEEQNEE